ncbi:MAG: hypothetical protein ACOCUI_04840 [bacterium]
MRVEAYPFPNRKTGLKKKEIYSYNNKYINLKEKNKKYEKKISSETSNIKNQYLYIENELLRSFQYVQPTIKNKYTSSVRFASIIRESANLYEIISESLYRKIYDIKVTDRLNIYNYLSLDCFLDLSNKVLYSPVLYGEFDGDDILLPYKSLENWDKNSKIESNNIPKWWKSYNKVKHDINGINDYATLENAILAVGAIYVIINRIYGEGVVGGILKKPKGKNGYIQLIVPVSKLFIEEIKIVASFG